MAEDQKKPPDPRPPDTIPALPERNFIDEPVDALSFLSNAARDAYLAISGVVDRFLARNPEVAETPAIEAKSPQTSEKTIGTEISAKAENGKFSAGDLVVLISCALFAEPFCHAAADAFLQEHYAKAALGFAIGMPAGLVGGTFHWWKDYLSLPARRAAVPVSMVFGAIGLVLAFFYIAGPEIYRRATIPAPVISTSSAAVASCWDGPCPPVNLKPGPEYLKEIGLGVGGPEPLVLNATPALTTDRIRIFVDYSEYRSGWMPKKRAFIGELKDPVKGKTESLQVIYYLANKPNAGPNNLWWGDPSQNNPVTTPTYGASIPSIIVRARLAIVGANGEQHHYFILIRGADNVGTLVGIIPQHDSGDWIENWEAD